jgi:DNA-binding response OmpR family regulator
VPQSILLVDDEFSFLEVLALLLAQEGYEISTASDGEEALVRLREKRPDLVVTDFWMPRMNGVELCQHMQENEGLCSIPILMMTATPHSVPRLPGLVGIVAKPMKFMALLALVRQVLRQPEEPA